MVFRVHNKQWHRRMKRMHKEWPLGTSVIVTVPRVIGRLWQCDLAGRVVKHGAPAGPNECLVQFEEEVFIDHPRTAPNGKRFGHYVPVAWLKKTKELIAKHARDQRRKERRRSAADQLADKLFNLAWGAMKMQPTFDMDTAWDTLKLKPTWMSFDLGEPGGDITGTGGLVVFPEGRTWVQDLGSFHLERIPPTPGSKPAHLCRRWVDRVWDGPDRALAPVCKDWCGDIEKCPEVVSYVYDRSEPQS